MKSIKHAIVFMGLGAMATVAVMKMMNCCDCDVNDLMKKEKKMFKNLKNKFMC